MTVLMLVCDAMCTLPETVTHLCAQVHARQGFTDADHGFKLTRGGGNTAILHSKEGTHYKS